MNVALARLETRFDMGPVSKSVKDRNQLLKELLHALKICCHHFTYKSVLCRSETGHLFLYRPESPPQEPSQPVQF